MKIISKTLIFIFISLWVISCSLTEEITFNENGSINFSYLLDASALMEMMPDSANTKGKAIDSTFSFATVLEEKKDSIAKLPIQEQQQIKSVENFNLRMKQNIEGKDFSIQLFGLFKNSNELNIAINALSNLSSDKTIKDSDKMKLMVHTQYDWNGKSLKTTATALKADSSSQNLLTMFNGGTFKVKYNFPKKIKKVSNPAAMISQDGKSLIIEYDATTYLETPEKTSLKIELEK